MEKIFKWIFIFWYSLRACLMNLKKEITNYYAYYFILIILSFIAILTIIIDGCFELNYPINNEYLIENNTRFSFFKEINEFINRAFIFSIPIVAAFFYFTYREQISLSARRENSFHLTMFMTCTPTVLIYGNIISFLLNQYANTQGELHTATSTVINIWIILIFCTLYYFYKIVSNSLNSIHEKKAFDKYMKQISKDKKSLYYCANKLKSIFFESMNSNLESAFQNINFSLENHLNDLLLEQRQEWEKHINSIMGEEPEHLLETLFIRGKKKKVDEKNIYLSQYYKENPENTRILYSAILRFHLKISYNVLRLENHFSSKNPLNAVNLLKPTIVPNLYKTYFKNLEELCINAYNNKEFPFELMLYTINDISKENINEINGRVAMSYTGPILLHQTLLKEAVEDGNVNKVTVITYSLTKPILNDENIQVKENTFNKEIELFMSRAIRKSQKDTFKEIPMEIKNLILFVLLQSLMKSIEIGQYGVSGQIVKRITTDFTGSSINSQLINFKKNKGLFNSSFTNEIQSSDIEDLDTIFNFSEQSFDYCFKKLNFLIYAQELYIKEMNIEFTEFNNDLTFVEIDLIDKDQLNYIYNKIISVGPKYGMLSLKEDFLKKYFGYKRDKKSFISTLANYFLDKESH
ncbi:hypothetical protein ATL39_1948 [Sinobaca qinghaiensis]|uniref:Uncharacterized protein n=1 Tax=Sinobaca qinghaiensis TaxID=342944 RepID=A0A419V5J6_9BACL|nr:hypothetical protein [Sinobaca qinghaiensis]RKD73646.1 hypothetical protein ATL39_1948 [Sinobaca qinghaiensis]